MRGALFAHTPWEPGARVASRAVLPSAPTPLAPAVLDELRELGRRHDTEDELPPYQRAFMQALLRHFQATSVELWRYGGVPPQVAWGMRMARSCMDEHVHMQPCEQFADEASLQVVRGLQAEGFFQCDGDGDGVGDGEPIVVRGVGRDRGGHAAALAVSVSINGHACSALVIQDAAGQRIWSGADLLVMRRAAALFALHLSRMAQSSRAEDSNWRDRGAANCLCLV